MEGNAVKIADAPSRNVFILVWAVLTAISFISRIGNNSSSEAMESILNLIITAALSSVIWAGIITFIAWKVFGIKEEQNHDKGHN